MTELSEEARKYMSELGKKGQQAMQAKSPEEKSAIAKKGWETRKKLRGNS